MTKLEAFELGERWVYEFVAPSRPIRNVITFVLGIFLTTFGSLPLVKLIFEDGSTTTGFVGAGMVLVGLVFMAITLCSDRAYYTALREAREAYRQKLIDSL